jgi:hypothetical protein
MAKERFAAQRRGKKRVARARDHVADQAGAMGNENGSRRRSHHDEEFGGLEEDPGVPVFEKIAAQNGGEDSEHTYKSEHELPEFISTRMGLGLRAKAYVRLV